MTTKLNPKNKSANTFEKVAAKYNEKLAVSTNGNVQFKKDSTVRLYELAVSTLFGRDTYYRNSSTLVNDLRKSVNEVVAQGKLDFIANLAIHTRIEMDIRTISVVLVVEFARALREQGVQYKNLRKVVCDVIQRADQINDMYAYALSVFGDKGKLPMAIKRGVADAFNKFNEYHFSKYNRGGDVKFRDVLRIVHPTAKDAKQGEIFEKIIKGSLATPYTWEVELSRNGQLPENERKSNKQIWTELLNSGKIGYMALLRNLRNIIKAGVDNDVLKARGCDVIADPVRVAQSKQFPHAFVLAHRAVKDIAPNGVLRAIEDALELSCNNIPQLGNDVVLLVDSSSSMQGDPNNKQMLAPADHASVLAAAIVKGNQKAFNLNVIYFDTSARFVKVDTSESVLQQAKYLRDNSIGGATRIEEAFKLMKKHNLNPDTIIVLSDMEVNRMYYGTMKSAVNTNAIKVAINFAASHSTPLSEKDGWYQLAGYSDMMFKFIPAMRNKVSIVDALNIPYVGADVVKQSIFTKNEEIETA